MILMENKDKIFITGATGTTGRLIAMQLRDNSNVVTGVHSLDKGEELQAAGINTRPFNFNNFDMMLEAFEGVKVLYLLTSDTEGFHRQVRSAIEAARQAGIEFVIRQSALGLSSHPDDHGSLMHLESERSVMDSGINWCILKPNFFMDSIISSHNRTLNQYGRFYGASEHGKISFISSDDVASCAAQILRDPQKHSGRIYRLTGPEALSYLEVAEVLCQVLDCKVDYVNLDSELMAEGLRSSGMADWLIETIINTEECIKQGKYALVTNDVQEITSHAPQSLGSYFRQLYQEGKIKTPESYEHR
jgi:NAD(P)H dehydrogenase (quinone)